MFGPPLDTPDTDVVFDFIACSMWKRLSMNQILTNPVVAMIADARAHQTTWTTSLVILKSSRNLIFLHLLLRQHTVDSDCTIVSKFKASFGQVNFLENALNKSTIKRRWENRNFWPLQNWSMLLTCFGQNNPIWFLASNSVCLSKLTKRFPTKPLNLKLAFIHCE